MANVICSEEAELFSTHVSFWHLLRGSSREQAKRLDEGIGVCADVPCGHMVALGHAMHRRREWLATNLAEQLDAGERETLVRAAQLMLRIAAEGPMP